MSQKTLNILFIGDIVGTPGLDLAATLMKSYVQKYEIDLSIANGENLVDGKGINEESVQKLFSLGVQVLREEIICGTTGTLGKYCQATGMFFGH